MKLNHGQNTRPPGWHKYVGQDYMPLSRRMIYWVSWQLRDNRAAREWIAIRLVRLKRWVGMLHEGILYGYIFKERDERDSD